MVTIEQPRPETVPCIPAPWPSPGPDTVEPAPDSPLRTSPRPSHTPRPSTDPRQFGHALMARYFGTVPESLKNIAGQASPFGGAPPTNVGGHINFLRPKEPKNTSATSRSRRSPTNSGTFCEVEKTGLPKSVIKTALQEELNVYADMPYPLTSDKYLSIIPEIEALQDGHENEIKQCISEYLRGLYGQECGSVLDRTEIEFARNDPGAIREIIQHLDLEGGNGKDPDQEQIEDDHAMYCAATVARAELYSLLIQGFSIIYMKDFLEKARERLETISPGLYDAYRKFFVISRINHFRLFRVQLETGRNPLGPEHSMGECDVCYEPVIDIEHPDTILDMNAYARATSPVGIILVHEALKASIQLLTVWAKRYENYCTKSEWLCLRMLVNSPEAEIRQFAIGPALFSCMQTGMARLGVDASLRNPDFYQFLQEWIGGETKRFMQPRKWFLRKGNDHEIRSVLDQS